MLKEISWSSYWIFIAYSLIAYYCIVLAMYDLKAKLAKVSASKTIWAKQTLEQEAVQKVPAPIQDDASSDFLYPPTDSTEFSVYACVDEVNAYLEEARRRKGNKDELITALQQIIAKYPTIKDTEYEASLSSVIVTQCAHLCFIHLTEADMSRVWHG